MQLKRLKRDLNDKTSELELAKHKSELFGSQKDQEDQSLISKKYYLEEAKKKLYDATDVTMNIGAELDRNTNTMRNTLRSVNLLD